MVNFLEISSFLKEAVIIFVENCTCIYVLEKDKELPKTLQQHTNNELLVRENYFLK